MNLKSTKSKLILSSFIAVPVLSVSIIASTTSCTSSSSDSTESSIDLSNLTFSQQVNLLYGDVEIKPTSFASQLTASSDNWPISNINGQFFTGYPKSKNGIEVATKEVKNYDVVNGQMTIIITYSKQDQQPIDKEYVISGFLLESEVPKSFQEKVNELYGNIKITLTNKGKQLNASPDIWDVSMINSDYFNDLPVSQSGITAKVLYVVANELNSTIDITYKYSDGNESITKEYTVTGFKQIARLDDLVNSVYENVQISPTNQAKALTATDSNWPLNKINSDYFNGLPTSQQGITVKATAVTCNSKDGVLFIDFLFTKGSQKTQRTYTVEGFKKI